MVEVSEKLGKKCTLLSLEPGTGGVRIHYAICSPTAASPQEYVCQWKKAQT